MPGAHLNCCKLTKHSKYSMVSGLIRSHDMHIILFYKM